MNPAQSWNAPNARAKFGEQSMKPPSRRQAQMDAFLQEELGKILEFEMSDERMLLVTVTGVYCSPSFQDAKVMVVVRGEESKRREVLKALEGATGHIRRLLAGRMKTRYTPKLQFLLDETLDMMARIDDLFEALHESEEKEA